jgi:hypothetical protein
MRTVPAILALTIAFQPLVRANGPGVPDQGTLQIRKVAYIAGFLDSASKVPSAWCMPDLTGVKEVAGTLVLAHDHLTFTPDDGRPPCSILYKEIIGLSRGTVPAPNPAGPAVTIGSALGGVLVGTLKSTVTKSATLGAAWWWYHSSRKVNYLGVTYGDGGRTGCQAEAGADTKTASTFYKGNLLLFRLANRSDYWNASMVLSAATGCEFVAETAEKGGAPK